VQYFADARCGDLRLTEQRRQRGGDDRGGCVDAVRDQLHFFDEAFARGEVAQRITRVAAGRDACDPLRQ